MKYMLGDRLLAFDGQAGTCACGWHQLRTHGQRVVSLSAPPPADREQSYLTPCTLLVFCGQNHARISPTPCVMCAAYFAPAQPVYMLSGVCSLQEEHVATARVHRWGQARAGLNAENINTGEQQPIVCSTAAVISVFLFTTHFLRVKHLRMGYVTCQSCMHMCSRRFSQRRSCAEMGSCVKCQASQTQTESQYKGLSTIYPIVRSFCFPVTGI